MLYNNKYYNYIMEDWYCFNYKERRNYRFNVNINFVYVFFFQKAEVKYALSVLICRKTE